MATPNLPGFHVYTQSAVYDPSQGTLLGALFTLLLYGLLPLGIVQAPAARAGRLRRGRIRRRCAARSRWQRPCAR